MDHKEGTYPTPRCNAEVMEGNMDGRDVIVVPASLARDLERELAAATSRLSEAGSKHDKLMERSVGAMAIAEGQEGHEAVPRDCPMLIAVSELRAYAVSLAEAAQDYVSECPTDRDATMGFLRAGDRLKFVLATCPEMLDKGQDQPKTRNEIGVDIDDLIRDLENEASTDYPDYSPQRVAAAKKALRDALEAKYPLGVGVNWKRIKAALEAYRCTFTREDENDGQGAVLVDVLAPPNDRTIERGEAELILLTDYLHAELQSTLSQGTSLEVKP